MKVENTTKWKSQVGQMRSSIKFITIYQASNGSVVRCGIDGEYIYPNPWPQCSEDINCGDPLPIQVNDPRLTPTAPPGTRTWIVGTEGDDYYKAKVGNTIAWFYTSRGQRSLHLIFHHHFWNKSIQGCLSLHRRVKIWHNGKRGRGHRATGDELSVAKILGAMGRSCQGGVRRVFHSAALHNHPLHQVGKQKNTTTGCGQLVKLFSNWELSRTIFHSPPSIPDASFIEEVTSACSIFENFSSENCELIRWQVLGRLWTQAKSIGAKEFWATERTQGSRLLQFDIISTFVAKFDSTLHGMWLYSNQGRICFIFILTLLTPDSGRRIEPSPHLAFPACLMAPSTLWTPRKVGQSVWRTSSAWKTLPMCPPTLTMLSSLVGLLGCREFWGMLVRTMGRHL